MKDNALILFFKHPDKHTVKTRLAACIGQKHALGLYKAFLADVFESVKGVYADLITAEGNGEGMAPDKYSGCIAQFPQRGADLGARMYNSLFDAFDTGYSRCILIGCDCPDLPGHVINDAFIELNCHDVVIGPAKDGGYYLIGFRGNSIRKEFFSGMSWGTSKVLEETLGKISSAGLSYFLTSAHEDIDNYDDLVRFASRNSGEKCTAKNTMRYLEQYREALHGKKI